MGDASTWHNRHTLTGRNAILSVSPQTFMGRAMKAPNLDLLQGTLDLLILKTLSWGPRHGYAIARWIAERTGDELVIEDGALYTGLHRLQKQGWVRSEWGRSENNRAAKYYELTPAGQKQLQVRVSVWERYAAAVTRVVRTA